MGLTRYKVFFTPLMNADDNEYGDEIDVSDRIDIGGIGSIKKGIDASDYNIGVFYFSDLTLNGYNKDGYFNDNDDSRSIFTSLRDRCKVRVVFSNTTVTRSSTGLVTDHEEEQTITFRGIINEEATRIDPTNDKITFKVLSRDSVLRTTNVSSGVIANGALAATAMFNILNVPRITSVLNIDQADISPDYNFTIDDGSYFNEKSVKEALDLLLAASNSILFINDAGDVFVRSRDEDTTNPIVLLFGKSDLYARENIIDIKSYNTGVHRTFTSVLINDTTVTDEDFAATYGFRQKEVEFPFITTLTTELEIGNRLVDEFKVPKIEMQVRVPTRISKALLPLDRVSINFPLRVKPIEGTFLPIVGVAQVDDDDTPLPNVFGSLKIPMNYGFKVLEIEDSPKDFTSTIKLRQINDLVFNAPNNCLVGFARIDEAAICAGGDACDTYNPSAVGAASVGCTMVA